MYWTFTCHLQRKAAAWPLSNLTPISERGSLAHSLSQLSQDKDKATFVYSGA